MFKLLFIFLTIFLNLYSQDYNNIENYYCKTNYELKILKISDNELILYGSEGGVISTYNDGNDWLQNYSGIKSKINKLLFHNNVVYGVTENGEFISSEDKGDFWNIKKISKQLTGITIINEVIYCSALNDTIYLSIDFGKTWITKHLPLKSIYQVSNFNNNLIISTQDNLYKISMDFTELIKITVPFNYLFINDKTSDFYIYNNLSIAKLNNDYTWTIYNIFNEENEFKFYPDENHIHLFSFNDLQMNPSIKYYTYSLNKNITEFQSEYRNNQMGRFENANLDFKPIDVQLINNDIFLTTYFKTIFKLENSEWNLISTNSTITQNQFLLNKSNLLILNNEGLSLLKSTNNGTIYNQISSIIDTVDNNKIRTKIVHLMNKDLNNSLCILDENGIDENNNVHYIKERFAFSNDGFKSIKKLPIIFNSPIPAIRYYSFIGYYNNDYYLNFYVKQKNIIRDTNNILHDSLYHTYIFKINSNNFEIDTLAYIKDSVSEFKIYFEKEKIWLYGNNNITNNEGIIYYSNNNGESFERVLTVNYRNYFGYTNIQGLFRNIKNNLFLITSDEIIQINEVDYSYKSYNVNQFQIGKVFKNPFEGKLEDQLFFTSYIDKSSPNFNIIKSIKKFNIEEELEHFEIIKLQDNSTLIFSEFDKSQIVLKNNGLYNNLFFPIEPERLAFYTSVEKTENRNYLYTFPPFPQPTKQEVKISTYWDSALPFTIDDVEIYNLAGIKINTENKLSINKETNYNGHIIWDTSGEQAGIYIVNIKHGTETRTQKILVEK